ncbi:WD40 repeat domain-containing serine/threonine protein kinase [Streptomyces sp. KHY 26]|uniref:WD40 repeat domain-containing serine/threonine protein kinase n=1 Tax=Streptomyces sp. KHY 26 TaxID=3097359 RepID=UPI00376F3912
MARQPAPVWEPGDVILDLYEVLDVASGGMGQVHRVRHRGWQMDLAVKTPRPEMVPTTDAVRRFEAEAGTWVGLGLHPHTVNCVYVRTIDGIPRVFAEWVAGGSLDEAIRTGSLYGGGRRAVLGRILDIAIQMAWGLEHAHDNGLVHQDVKPANVMLEPDGTAKITDFGLARVRTVAGEDAARRPSDRQATATYRGLTKEYCSPEQAAAKAGRRGTRMTVATDVWSWALSVLEMFVGERTWQYGQVAPEVLEAYLRDGGAACAGLPEMPSGVASVLRQCFAQDPTARPSGFDVLAATLRDLHVKALGTAHDRPTPRAAALRADSLSNQALSLLDLGTPEEAQSLWLKALRVDPHHLPTVYNFGLHEWRSGRRSGEELVSDLEAARAAETTAPPGLGALLLGAAELELQETDRAGKLLQEAVAADPSSTDAAAALAEWKRRLPRPSIDLDGHSEEISAITVSTDGSRVLSADVSGRLLLWTPGERRTRRTLTRRGLPVTVAAMDGAGTLAVIVRDGTVVEIWDLKRSRVRGRLNFRDGALRIQAVAVSGDGRYVATGRSDGAIHRWDAEQERLVTFLIGHTRPITSLALSPDGSRGLSAAFDQSFEDGTVRYWDMDDQLLLAQLVGPVRAWTMTGEPVQTLEWDAAAVSADARTAVVAWQKGPLTVWDAETCTLVSEVPHHVRSTRSMAAATTRPVLLTAPAGGPFQVWDVSTGRLLRGLDHQLPSDGRWVEVAVMSADGRIVVLGSRGGRVTVLPLAEGGYEAPWCYARPRSVPELTRAAEVYGEHMERFWDLRKQGRPAAAAEALRSAQQVPGFARDPEVRAAWTDMGAHGRRGTLLSGGRKFEYRDDEQFTQPPTLALDQHGVHMATGRWTGEVDVWDFATAQRVHTFARDVDARDIRFALDGGMLLVWTLAGTIRRLALDGGPRSLRTDWGPVTCFAVAGDRILTGAADGILHLRDLRTGRNLHTVRAHAGPVHALALGPEGFIASLGSARPKTKRGYDPQDEYEAGLWLPGRDRPAWTAQSVPDAQRLEFSSDGRFLFIVAGTFVTAVDTATGMLEYQVFNAGLWGEGQTDIDFTTDGRLAASAHEQRLRVWETATGHVAHTVPLPPSPYSFALAADGTFAVTGGRDRMVRVWDVRSGRCLRTLEGHNAGIQKVVLSRDGTRLATVDVAGGLWLWELSWDYEVPPGGEG